MRGPAAEVAANTSLSVLNFPMCASLQRGIFAICTVPSQIYNRQLMMCSEQAPKNCDGCTRITAPMVVRFQIGGAALQTAPGVKAAPDSPRAMMRSVSRSLLCMSGSLVAGSSDGTGSATFGDPVSTLQAHLPCNWIKFSIHIPGQPPRK